MYKAIICTHIWCKSIQQCKAILLPKWVMMIISTWYISLKLIVFSNTILLTHQPNEDFNIRNEQAKRSINLWLGMYVNAEKHIFEILPYSLFEGTQNSKAKPPNRPKFTACIAYSKKECVVGFQKCVFLH